MVVAAVVEEERLAEWERKMRLQWVLSQREEVAEEEEEEEGVVVVVEEVNQAFAQQGCW